MRNILKETFGSEKRWVNWRFKVSNGKKTKLPYSIKGSLASSTDETTWSTYDDAFKASLNMGIVFTPEKKLLGIDIDHILNKTNIEHEQKELIVQFLIEADTYTEISPSLTGLHLFFKLTEPLTLTANKRAPFELYTSGRYFTVTNNPYKEEKEVRTITPDEALKLLAIIGYPWKEQNKESVGHSLFDNDTLLKKMFASKNGATIEALYNGDVSQNGKDHSAADLSLCSHLAFWTNKDEQQIEKIWLQSPLGNRKKTQERADYRQRTIATAIAGCKDTYESLKQERNKDKEELDLLFTLNKEKEPVYTQNTENICRILRKHEEFAGNIRFDAFKNSIEIRSNGVWRSIEDNDAVNFQTRISILFSCFGKVGKEMVFDALIKVAKEQSIDSAADYMKSLVWDGTQRLDSWLSKVYGAPEDLYHKAVGSNWLKGLVKRIMEPGCKFDYVLVLEGPQGSRKSTSLYVLGRDWHVETAMSTDSKDFFMQFQGKAIIEFSEGETLSRTEVKRMKAIITMQSDRYRPSYGRTSQDFPRRSVFAMTTNQSEYLKDETGNRRWLPVTVVLPEANTDWLLENRNQLFAEAYHRVITLKETVYEFPKQETLAAQDARRIQDPNTDLIIDWYYNKLTKGDRNDGISIHDVFSGAFGGVFDNKKMLTKWEEMSISNILKNVMLLEKKRSMRGGVQLYRWFEKEGNKSLGLYDIEEPVEEEIKVPEEF